MERVELGIEGASRRNLSALLTGAIVPRPIAWVSSIDEDGVLNLAPHSYFNAIANDPPLLYFQSSNVADAPGGVKDTLRNIRATQEFVVNVPSTRHITAVAASASRVAPEIDEAALAGVTMAASTTVRPARVADAAVALECRLEMVLSIGGANVVFGRIQHASIAAEVLRRPIDAITDLLPGDFDPKTFDPLIRLGGIEYASLGEVMEAPILSPEELGARGSQR